MLECLRAGGAKMPDITDENKNLLLLLCACLGLASRVRAVLQAGANAGHINQNGNTALMLACANEQEVAAGELMEATKRAGALDLQAKDDYPIQGYKGSALHLASAKGLAGTVAQLLALGADATLTDTNQMTPLYVSAAMDSEAACRVLIEHRANVNAQDQNQQTPLHVSAAKGSEAACRVLIEHGANVNAQGQNQQTPLHVSAAKGSEAACRVLIEHRANVNAQDKNGCTALWLACHYEHEGAAAELMEATKLAGALDLQHESSMRSALHKASEKGLAGTVAQLLSHGADAALKDKNGDTALMLACMRGHDAAAGELMEATKRAGALDLQAKENYPSYKRSALHWASAKGLAGTVAKLLALGADATRTDEYGRTALWEACDNKHEGAAAELMEATKLAGALDLQAKDDYPGYKRSALHLASEKGLAGTVAKLLALGADATLTDRYGKTAVEHAGNDKVKAAFVEHVKAVDITDENKDELMLLCACLGLASLLRAVLQAGANAGHINQRGKTSLTVAMEHKQEAAVEVLLQAMIAAGIDIDARDKQGQTLLMRASALGLTSTVAKLLALGADVAVKDQNGKGAFDHAMEQKHEAAVEVLLQAMIAAGIDIDAEIADFAGLYNHLVAKQRMGPTEAAEYVARQYDKEARKEGVPTLAESDGRGRSSLYTLAAAAASWDGVEKHSIPYAESFVGVAIGKVLKSSSKIIHPDLNITMQGKKTVEDMLAYVLDAVAKVAGHSCRAVTTRFCHVPTGSYLDPEYAKADCNAVTVLQTRTVPSDQVLLARLSEGEFAGQAWWESRGEVVRVGLGGAVAQHEAKDPSERGNALLEHLKRAQEQPGEDTVRAIVMAVRQVFPGSARVHVSRRVCAGKLCAPKNRCVRLCLCFLSMCACSLARVAVA